MPTLHSTPGESNTDLLAPAGFTIRCDDLTQQWYGWGWSRIDDIYTENYSVGPMTEAEARAWLAEVAG